MNEIEETLARESRDGGESYLIPITLDDYVFKDWAPKNADVAQAVRDRVVADFRGADKDDERFSAALVRLIGALQKKSPNDTQAMPSPAPARHRIAVLTLEYKGLRITQAHHDYELIASLKNIGARRIDDWELEVRFPTEVLDGTVYACKVEDQSDAEQDYVPVRGPRAWQTAPSR